MYDILSCGDSVRIKMQNIHKTILFLCFAILTLMFARTAIADQEMPEFCTFALEAEETSSTSIITLDGTAEIEPAITDENSEYLFLLPRADNGRGNGSIHYSNPILPIGDDHNYALIDLGNIDDEDQPNDDPITFPGIIGQDDELVFQISNLEKRGTFLLYKVLTIEEVVECNQFLDNKIDLDSLYSTNGLVYIPLNEYGITDKFSVGIKAPVDNSTENDTTNGKDNDDFNGNGSDNGINNDGDDGYGPPPPPPPGTQPSG